MGLGGADGVGRCDSGWSLGTDVGHQGREGVGSAPVPAPAAPQGDPWSLGLGWAGHGQNQLQVQFEMPLLVQGGGAVSSRWGDV